MQREEMIGENVKKYRLLRCLNQEDLAPGAGISEHYLSDIENGKRNPSARILCRLAEALDIQVTDLTGPPALGGFVKKLAALCADYDVSLLHLQDIVDDCLPL